MKNPVDLYGIDISEDVRNTATKRNSRAEKNGLVDLGKEAGFEKAEVRDVVKDKSLMVIYTK